MTGAVDVSIVARIGLELDVGRGDGDTTLALLGGLVNGTILEEAGQTLGGLVLGDGGSQGGLGTRHRQETGIEFWKRDCILPFRDRRDRWYQC